MKMIIKETLRSFYFSDSACRHSKERAKGRYEGEKKCESTKLLVFSSRLSGMMNASEHRSTDVPEVEAVRGQKCGRTIPRKSMTSRAQKSETAAIRKQVSARAYDQKIMEV